jgi:hypothetical protein
MSRFAVVGGVNPVRNLRHLALATVLVAGCGGAPAASSPETPKTTEPPAPSEPVAAPVEPSRTPDGTSEPGMTPEGDVVRGSGSGSIAVDGAAYELEVAVCGWNGGGRTRALQPDPGARQLFQLIAVQGVGAGMVALELQWDGVVGNIDTAVISVDPSDPGAAFHYHYDLQPIDLVAIDGGHVLTREPLRVFDGSNIITATEHELEVDITCDAFGGMFDGAAPIVAEITGLQPLAPAAGEVTIDGIASAVDVTRCSRTGDEVELEAVSQDRSIRITLSVTPGFTFLVFSVEGRVLTVAGETDIQVDGDGVGTGSSIRGEIAGRGPAEVTFELPCS